MEFTNRIKEIIDFRLDPKERTKEKINFEKLIKETDIEQILDEKFKNIESHINYKDLMKMTDDDIVLEILNTYLVMKDILVIKEEYLEEVDKSVNDKSDYFYEDSVKAYIHEIGKYPLLTVEQERELIKMKEVGYPEARKKLIEHNLRLVVSIAHRYYGRGLDFSDLIEEGNIGLIKSIDKHKSQFGIRISTYATYWINQSISRAIDYQSRLIRFPVHASQGLSKIEKSRQELLERNQKEPTSEELSKKTKLSKETIELLIKMSINIISLEKTIGEDNEDILGNLLSDPNQRTEDTATFRQLQDYVSSVLNSLTSREREVIKKRFGIGMNYDMTLEEVGKELNITKERVRQIEAKALKKLRHPRNTRKIKDYVD